MRCRTNELGEPTDHRKTHHKNQTSGREGNFKTNCRVKLQYSKSDSFQINLFDDEKLSRIEINSN